MTIEGKELVKVIKACRASGVSYLKLGDLELKFGTGEAAATLVPATGEAVRTPSASKLKEIEENSTEEQNLVDAEEELAFMQVDDPATFEELLVQRELEDGGPGIERESEFDDRRVEQAL